MSTAIGSVRIQSILFNTYDIFEWPRSINRKQIDIRRSWLALSFSHVYLAVLIIKSKHKTFSDRFFLRQRFALK